MSLIQGWLTLGQMGLYCNCHCRLHCMLKSYKSLFSVLSVNSLSDNLKAYLSLSVDKHTYLSNVVHEQRAQPVSDLSLGEPQRHFVSLITFSHGSMSHSWRPYFYLRPRFHHSSSDPVRGHHSWSLRSTLGSFRTTLRPP